VSFGSFIDQFLQALGGTGDCAKVDWTWLTLSIAEWSLLSFIFLFGVGVWFLWRKIYNAE
jgi:disulfide bond formation protein DsbB